MTETHVSRVGVDLNVTPWFSQTALHTLVFQFLPTLCDATFHDLVLSHTEGGVFFNFVTLVSRCLFAWACPLVSSFLPPIKNCKIFAVSYPPPVPHPPCGTENSIDNSFPFVEDELDEWIKAQGWTIQEDGKVFICNQEAHIKSKNIAEIIDFECKWLVGFYS